jgi:hypothetical protein
MAIESQLNNVVFLPQSRAVSARIAGATRPGSDFFYDIYIK